MILHLISFNYYSFKLKLYQVLNMYLFIDVIIDIYIYIHIHNCWQTGNQKNIWNFTNYFVIS